MISYYYENDNGGKNNRARENLRAPAGVHVRAKICRLRTPVDEIIMNKNKLLSSLLLLILLQRFSYLAGDFFRYFLFAADTQHPGQRLRKLHGTRSDDDRGGWSLVFCLLVYTVVMVMVVIRGRLGIHNAGKDGVVAKRIVDVDSATAASRHGAR